MGYILTNSKEKVFISKSIMWVYFIPAILLVFSIPELEYEGSTFSKFLNLSLYCVFFMYAFMNMNKTINMFLGNKLLVCFILLIPFNIIFAYNPNITVQYSITLLGEIIISVVLAMNLSLKEWSKVLGWYFCILSLLNLIVILLFPSLGIHQDAIHGGAWKGVVGHKNSFGTLSVLGFVYFFVQLFMKKGNRFYNLLFVGINGVFILMSSSKTAMLIVIALLAFLFYRSIYNYFKKISINLAFSIGVFLALIIGLIGIVVYLNLDFILNAMGRDRSLTGRTEIYEFSFAMIKEKMLLGYGYGGFWNSPYQAIISDRIWLDLRSSHSGFLDIWLDFGLVGLVIIILIILAGIKKAIVLNRISRTPYLIWPMLFFVFTIINNITDSRFIHSRSIYWILFLVTVFIISKEIKQKGGYKK